MVIFGSSRINNWSRTVVPPMVILLTVNDAIPMMELLKEMKHQKVPIRSVKGKVHCQVFKDNSGALEMAKVHKYHPRRKHLNVPSPLPILCGVRANIDSPHIHYRATSGIPY